MNLLHLQAATGVTMGTTMVAAIGGIVGVALHCFRRKRNPK